MHTFSLSAIAIGLLIWFNLAEAGNLIDTATSAGSFKTFLTCVKNAGLSESLKTQGPFTIFAPSDEAFQKLPRSVMKALMRDKVQLAQLLSHHIVPGKILVAEVKPGAITTIQGDTVTLTSDNGKVTIDGANVTQSDLSADNGVIQVIDTVMLPKQILSSDHAKIGTTLIRAVQSLSKGGP